MELAPERILGAYRLIEKIGAGGMGEVWKAEDTRLGRAVALKILPPSLAGNAELKARLAREARTAAQLSNPHVATIHAIEQDDERSYIVMEYVDGEPLSKKLARREISEVELCRIGKAVADALAEAHEKGIVHRDIKPDNIMIAGDRVKVLDFGIAKQTGIESATGKPTFVTEAGMILGTVHYMSPEQALGRPLDGRSDIFSLGVVLYEAVTGKLPFEGETVTEVLTQIIRDEPRDVADVSATVMPQLAKIIRRCMQKARDDRYATARELSAAFDAAFGAARTVPAERMAAAAPPAKPRRTETPASAAAATVKTGAAPVRKRGWLVPAIVAVLAIAVFAIGGGILRRRSHHSHVAKVAALQPPVVAATTPTAPPSSTSIDVNAPPPVADMETTSNAVIPVTKPKASPKTDASVDDLYRDARSFIAAEDYASARSKLGEILAFAPDFAPALADLAKIQLVAGENDEALANFQRALDHSEKLNDRQRDFAVIGLTLAQGDQAAARRLGRQFEVNHPRDAEFHTFIRKYEQRYGGVLPRPLRGRFLKRP